MTEYRLTECPCCKGNGTLEFVEMWGNVARATCTHCSGGGKIMSEETMSTAWFVGTSECSATQLEILERYSTPGLRKTELTRADKRWHLYDMYSWPLGETEKNRWAANEIEKILNELFKQESHDDRD
jgi:hypothetical protein